MYISLRYYSSNFYLFLSLQENTLSEMAISLFILLRWFCDSKAWHLKICQIEKKQIRYEPFEGSLLHKYAFAAIMNCCKRFYNRCTRPIAAVWATVYAPTTTGYCSDWIYFIAAV